MRSMIFKCKQFFSEIISQQNNKPTGTNESNQPEIEMIRLSKWMSLQSICSRRQAEDFIRLGLVRVDGKRLFENAMVPINSGLRSFTPEGFQTKKPITKLWMINKPRECICTHNDPQKRKTIYSILPRELNKYGHIMSVGRLDFNSQGLLLLTNDSTLKELLENPKANLERFYRVKVHGSLNEKKLEKMSHPILIKGIQYGPLRVQVERSLRTNSWLSVSLMTGKNRQIRRIMEKCDLQVNKLIREGYGKYKLGSLQQGDVRELPLSQNMQRKLKLTKGKQLIRSQSKGVHSLIEVDIRKSAIDYALKEKHQLDQNSTLNKPLTSQKQSKQEEKQFEERKRIEAGEDDFEQ